MKQGACVVAHFVQPTAHGAQVQRVSEIQEVAVDAPGGPLPVPPQGLDQLNDRRRGALSAAPRLRGAIGQTRLTGGELSGHPCGHRGSRNPELYGHMGLRDTVVDLAEDHAWPAGRSGAGVRSRGS